MSRADFYICYPPLSYGPRFPTLDEAMEFLQFLFANATTLLGYKYNGAANLQPPRLRDDGKCYLVAVPAYNYTVCIALEPRNKMRDIYDVWSDEVGSTARLLHWRSGQTDPREISAREWADCCSLNKPSIFAHSIK